MTYAEILAAFADQGLKDKVKVAMIVSADAIRAEDPRTVPNHEARKQWARLAFQEPDSQVPAILWAVLAQNKALTSAQVLAASDSAVQTAVDAAVNAFAI
jgi:hypothetical protein